MSHIPSSAMPHAGPTHHDEPKTEAHPAVASIKARPGGWPVAAIALGGAIALGVVAMAVPLFGASDGPVEKKPKAKGKRKARG